MKYLTMVVCCLALRPAAGQPAVNVEEPKMTLDERYQLMKSRGQTYEEYKVIKEFVLDGVWKITKDSLRGLHSQHHADRDSLSRLVGQLRDSREALSRKEAAQAGLVFDSTHMTLMGVSFSKGMFVTIVVTLILALIALLGLMAGKIKAMHDAVADKTDLAAATIAELEECKRKSLEKQTKLSRELQNERNKLQELKRG